MARKFEYVVATVMCATVGLAIFGCGTTESGTPGPEAMDSDMRSCDDDCVQPPVLRDEMVSYLQEHQERILERNAYRESIPSVTKMLRTPVIDDMVREGPEVVDGDGEPFDGELNWHYVEFDEVTTSGVDAPANLRGRDVSGAHCFFARKPNYRTTTFALLAAHHGDRDSLYLAGPRHPVTSLDTAPVSGAHPGSIRLAGEGIRCAFRHDQNIEGVLFIPIEYTGSSAPEGTYYAAYIITPDTQDQPTGDTVQVLRSRGLWSQEVTAKVEIPLREYGEPVTEFIGVYDELYDAMTEADEAVTPGGFRLRPEMVYSTLPWQAYFSTGKEEFCPKYAECHIPTMYLDFREFTPLSAEFMALISNVRAADVKSEEDEGKEDGKEGIDTEDEEDKD